MGAGAVGLPTSARHPRRTDPGSAFWLRWQQPLAPFFGRADEGVSAREAEHGSKAQPAAGYFSYIYQLPMRMLSSMADITSKTIQAAAPASVTILAM